MYGDTPIMTNDDYQAHEDAQHLMKSREVKADPQRHAKAKAAANRMADEKFEEAKNLKKAAKGIGSGKSSGPALPPELAKDGWTIG